MLGKLVHIGFDVLLISALLAGIKRSTGLTYAYAFSYAFSAIDNGITPDLNSQRSLTRTCVVSHDLQSMTICEGANIVCPEFLRSYLEFGTFNIPEHGEGLYVIYYEIGEYAFDFAVVFLGVCCILRSIVYILTSVLQAVIVFRTKARLIVYLDPEPSSHRSSRPALYEDVLHAGLYFCKRIMILYHLPYIGPTQSQGITTRSCTHSIPLKSIINKSNHPRKLNTKKCSTIEPSA